MRTRYFGHWRKSPCTISVAINDVKVLRHVQVLGLDQGRTTHDIFMEDLTDEPSTVAITFEKGLILYLWEFDILVINRGESYNAPAPAIINPAPL